MTSRTGAIHPMRTLLPIGAALVAAAGAANAQFVQIAYESFDYPPGTFLGDQAGGSGWANVWWSGAGLSDADVVYPGIDAVGGMAQTLAQSAGSYRKPDPAGFDDITVGGKFGADGSTIWMSWWQQRKPGTDEDFGGVSIIDQFVAERFFVGSPSFTQELGIHIDPWGPASNVISIPGTSADTLSRVVSRIDFQAGDERYRLWINPAVDHPVTPADIDVLMPDMVFNEIGFQSGNIVTASGWYFDEFVIECEGCGGTAAPFTGAPSQISVAAGGSQVWTMDAGAVWANEPYLVLGTFSGQTPGFPIDGFTVPINPDAYWILTFTAANVPPLNGSFGVLDANGQASGSWDLPAGALPQLAGFVADHAYLVLDTSGPGPFVGFVSNPVSLAFVP